MTATAPLGAPSVQIPSVSPRSGLNIAWGLAVPAFLMAYLFVGLAFELRPLEEWEDLFGYVQRYSLDPYYGTQIPDGILDYAFAEYGWQLIVRFLFNQGYQFDDAFFVLSVLSLGTTAYVILSRTRSFLVLPIFLNPAMIDFYISQVRSALAFAIMLITIQRRLPIALVGIALASTIHTSMLLMTVPLAIDFVRKRFGASGKVEAVASHVWPLAALAVAITLSTFQVYILDFFGDRRANYVLSDLGAGTLFTAGWTLIGVTFYLCTRARSTLAGIAATFLVSMFFLAGIYGLYAHRYIPYFLLFMMLSLGASETPKEYRWTFIAVYAAFSAVYFTYWL